MRLDLSLCVPAGDDSQSTQSPRGRRRTYSLTRSSHSPSPRRSYCNLTGIAESEWKISCCTTANSIAASYFQTSAVDLAKRIALLQDYQTALSAAEAAVIDEERKRLRVLSQVSSDLEAYLTWIEALEDRSDLSPSSIKVFDSGLDQRRQLGLPPVDESVVNRSFLRSVRLLARSSENVPMTDVSAMEWRDPYSRRFEGSGLWEKYKGSATHLGFFTWLEEQSACRGEVWQGLKKIEKSVIYLREDERPRYLVSVKRDGAYTLLCQEGSNLDTSKFRSISSGEGTGIFVLGLDGKLYAAAHSESERGLMHHSSFFAGGDVLSAGELVVEQGVLKSLSNRSGHYRPDWKDPMLAVLDHLHNKGVDLSAVRLELVGTAELSDEIILSDGTKKTVPFSVRMTAHVDAGIFHENRGEDVAYTHGWVRRIGRWKGRLKEALSELDPELLGGAQVALRTLYGVDRDMTPWTGADKWNFYGAADFLHRDEQAEILRSESVDMPERLKLLIKVDGSGWTSTYVDFGGYEGSSALSDWDHMSKSESVSVSSVS